MTLGFTVTFGKSYRDSMDSYMFLFSVSKYLTVILGAFIRQIEIILWLLVS